MESTGLGEAQLKVGDLNFPPRKIWIKTFGCQMNTHDSERLLSHLQKLNFSQTSDLPEADLVLFNTCAIRDLANQKFYSQLGEIKHAKQAKKDLVVGVGGCIAQTDGKELLRKYSYLNFTFGTDVLDTINDMVFRAYAGDNKFTINAWDRSSNFSIETKITHNSPQAFINIIKGCNKYCSYCIVPYTRGKERSRKIDEIVKDVQNLCEYQGIREITLLGQNVNSFGKEHDESLADLLYELEKIKKLKLIRYTTSHPYDVSDELIAAHGTLKKLSNHLHLPVQSGSNSVLRRMLREYTVEHFSNLCKKLRSANPSIVLSTDIIVGFIDETREEFDATLLLLKNIKFDSIFSYVYSKRQYTRAALLPDLLPLKTKKSRLQELQSYQLKIQGTIRRKLLGRTFKILVEGTSVKKGVRKWKGRTNCNRLVHFKGKEEGLDYLWKWVDVKIIESTPLSCQGVLLG